MQAAASGSSTVLPVSLEIRHWATTGQTVQEEMDSRSCV